MHNEQRKLTKGPASSLTWILEPAYHISSRRTITRLVETHYEERNKVPRAGQVSAEVPVHPGNAGVFGGWTDGHQVAVASDPRSCQHAYLSQQKSVDWCRSCM